MQCRFGDEVSAVAGGFGLQGMPPGVMARVPGWQSPHVTNGEVRPQRLEATLRGCRADSLAGPDALRRPLELGNLCQRDGLRYEGPDVLPVLHKRIQATVRLGRRPR